MKRFLQLLCLSLIPIVAQNEPSPTFSNTDPTLLHWDWDRTALNTKIPASIQKITVTEQLAERSFIHEAHHMIDNLPATAWCAEDSASKARIFVYFDRLPAGMSLTPGFAVPALWSTNRRITKIRVTFLPFDLNGTLGKCYPADADSIYPEIFVGSVNPVQLSAQIPSLHYFDFRGHFTNNMIADCYTLAIIQVIATEGSGDTCISEIKFYGWR